MSSGRPTRDDRLPRLDDLSPQSAKDIDDRCDFFERHLGDQTPPEIESLLGGFRDPERSVLLRELLLVELETLLSRDVVPQREQYFQRFPNHPSAVREALETVMPLPPPRAEPEPEESWPSLPNYQILREISHGGMGRVYEALQPMLNRTVALKVLRENRLHDLEAERQFEEEMKLIGPLLHPNIVTAIDGNKVGDLRYLAMEYVKGLDVETILQRLGPLPVADACEIARRAALALQHAHQHRLVHRDIKPKNILVGRSPPNAPEVEVKVADFGMALLRGTTVIKGASAPYAHIVGTYPFMAPEQYWQVAADIRSDVYSLGCTLYCLLLGHPPFSPPQYTTPEQIMAAHRDTTVEPFLQRRPDVPESLEKLILAMLAKLPQQRCQTPGEVAAAMSSFIRGCDLAALLSRAMAAPHPARVGPPPGRHENQGTPPKEPDPNVKATPNPIRVEETVSYVKCPPIPVAPAEPPPAEPPPPRAEPSQQPPATVSQPHPPGFFKASDFASWARRRLAAAEPLPLDRRAWLSVLLAAGVLLGVWLIWMMCFRRAAAIDLLALAFAQGAQGENAWKWEDGALVSPEAPYSRFQIPQAPPRYFRLEIEESRVSPGGLLVVGLPYNGTQVTVPLDVPSIVADVEEDGSSRKEVADAAARFRFSGGPSKTHTCIVSSQGILAAYENQVTWVWISGRPLPRLDVQWRAAESGRLFLGTHYSPHRFTRLSLTPLYSHVGDSWAILLHGSEPFPSE